MVSPLKQLEDAYTQAATDLGKSKEPPKAAKVGELYNKMKAALDAPSAARSLLTEPVDRAAQVQALHDTFLKGLKPEQQIIFLKIEGALEKGLSLPASVADTALIDPKLAKENERLAEIAKLNQSIGQKSAGLQALRSLEFPLWKLLENQTGKVLSEKEKAATSKLCENYLKACSEELAKELKECKTVGAALISFEKTIQFLRRMKESSVPEESFTATAQSLISNFTDVATEIISTNIKNILKQAGDDNEVARPLYHILSLLRQSMLKSNPGAALNLNEPILRLGKQLNIQESAPVAHLQALGDKAMPVARTAAKTANLARFIIPAVGYSLKAMYMYAHGATPQEILLSTANGLLVQGVKEGIKRHTPASLHFALDFAAPFVAHVFIEKATNSLLRTYEAPVYGPESQPKFPNIPAPAKHPVLPTSPMPARERPVFGPESQPKFPNIPAPFKYPILPTTPASTAGPSWWSGVAEQASRVAQTVLTTATQYGGKAITGAALIVSLTMKEKIGLQ